ncbi:MAG: HD domain-containing protein [Candidatus Izimaplasma sp.]|nr:HD domain-containing protein [Candidatus Izimaplasma bacterium]
MLELDKNYKFYGKVTQVNESTYDTYPVNVTTDNNENVIVRIKQDEEVLLNKIYLFETRSINFKEKIHLEAINYQLLETLDVDDKTQEKLMKFFYEYAPVKISFIKKDIETIIDSLENETIKKLTKTIYEENKNDFYLYPAASRFHHAYISGLAYHTHSMLKLAKGFMKVYKFLNKDLLMSGIIIHDICKISEFKSYENAEYTIKGKLLGHISMGVNLLEKTATRLNLEGKEEVMLLEHIMLSHHYYGNFGSPKKPNIAEALMIHFIDNIDSKACVLGEELEQTQEGELTKSIAVLERERYYKHKLTNE